MNFRKAYAARSRRSVGDEWATINVLRRTFNKRAARPRKQFDVTCSTLTTGWNELRPSPAREPNIFAEPKVFLLRPRTNLADDQAVTWIEFHRLLGHLRPPTASTIPPQVVG